MHSPELVDKIIAGWMILAALTALVWAACGRHHHTPPIQHPPRLERPTRVVPSGRPYDYDKDAA